MFNKVKKKILEWLDFQIQESSEDNVVFKQPPSVPVLTEEDLVVISYVEEHLFVYSDGVKIDVSKWDVEYVKDDFFTSSNWDIPVHCSVVNISSSVIPYLSFKLYIPSLVVKEEGLVGRYPLMVQSCSLISQENLPFLAEAINKSKNGKLDKHDEYVRTQHKQRVKEAIEAITKEKE